MTTIEGWCIVGIKLKVRGKKIMIAQYAHANPHFSPSFGELKSPIVLNGVKYQIYKKFEQSLLYVEARKMVDGIEYRGKIELLGKENSYEIEDEEINFLSLHFNYKPIGYRGWYRRAGDLLNSYLPIRNNKQQVFNDLKNIGLKTCDWTGVEEVPVVCDHDWQPDCEGVYCCSKCGELCELD